MMLNNKPALVLIDPEICKTVALKRTHSLFCDSGAILRSYSSDPE